MWGVTYSSMLAAAKITGDDRYKKYVENLVIDFLTSDGDQINLSKYNFQSEEPAGKNIKLQKGLDSRSTGI